MKVNMNTTEVIISEAGRKSVQNTGNGHMFVVDAECQILAH